MPSIHDIPATPTPSTGVYSMLKRGPSDTMALSTGAAINLGTSYDSSGDDITVSNSTRFVVGSTGVYRLGGFVCVQSASQRAQFALEIYTNGTGDGILRGSGYIRNSGTAHDYWILELSAEPMNLSANDYIEVYVGETTTTSYGFGNNGTQTLQASGRTKLWLERIT